jgi:L-rhamnose-H+ transport protein
MPESVLALVLLVVAGAMNGSFTLPMKFTGKWGWENTWLAWTVFALALFPVSATLMTVPRLGEVYSQAGTVAVAVVAACGAGWGVSQVFLGLAVDTVGIGLAFSVILGIGTAVGALVPLFRKGLAGTASGATVMAGVALVLVGIAICAVAGRRREAALGTGPKSGRSVMTGLLFCLFSGLGSALTNLGLDFGEPVRQAAMRLGADPIWAPNAAWLLVMCAGCLPNLLYCLYLVRRNGTGKAFNAPRTGHYWLLAAVMAFFWFGSTVMYGVSTVKLGALGIVAGWPLFMSLIIITAGAWGVIMGEWKGTGRQPLRIQAGGVAVLVLAIVVLSRA